MRVHRLLFATALTLTLSITPASTAIIDMGDIDTPGDATAVFVDGGFAYVADNQGGLRVIDVSNPEEPAEAGTHFETPGPCLSAAKEGDLLYIGWGQQGIRVFDVSDIDNPEEIGRFEAQCIVNDIVIAGDYAYVADMISGLRIIDVSDPENMRQVGLQDRIVWRIIKWSI